MPKSTIQTAISVCKSIMRNGYDAYAINAPLQKLIIEKTNVREVDIACGCEPETLVKIFPSLHIGGKEGAMAQLQEEEVLLHFYPADVESGSHPERGQLRITPRMLRMLQTQGSKFNATTPRTGKLEEGFEDYNNECVKLQGLPAVTLAHNYLLAIRALRHAANYELPIEPHTWMAIVQSSSRVLDYVPLREVMEEWRLVLAENMWKFVQLLFDSQILHGLIPEIAALSRVVQDKDDEGGAPETIFDHTISCMKHYPEGQLPYDWYGVMAVLFHDVGKLYTGEYLDGKWTYYQHHRVGAGVTRKILRRLHFSAEDIDLICHLVRHHMMFHFMLTDRGVRRFKALSENQRLIEICRADLKARGASSTYFNHNSKYLNRAETSELMLEPLLNGNEIMEHTKLPPGPGVGNIREALLKAQIAGLITDTAGAVEFVKKYQQ